jgi:hypothetical protein
MRLFLIFLCLLPGPAFADCRSTTIRGRRGPRYERHGDTNGQAAGLYRPDVRRRAMTAAERRERARLRSERWRRARGIMPRKPAQKPWLAEGCGRSRHSKQARERAAMAVLNSTIDRASAFVRELQAELAEVARCQAVTAAIIGELSGIHE